MQKKIIILTFVTILSSIAAFFLYKNYKNKTLNYYKDEVLSSYILAYTTGNISTESSIVVEFSTNIVNENAVNQEAKEEIFDFSPSIKGKTIWKNRNTVEFIPNENLKSDTKFDCTLDIGKILQVPENLKLFAFDFNTSKQNFDVELFGIYYQNEDIENMLIKGAVHTQDPANNQLIEKMMVCQHNITWNHATTRDHYWQIEGIKKQNSTQNYKISWIGNEIEADKDIEKYCEIPSLNSFRVLDVNVFQGNDQFIKVIFSEPLNKLQDFSGIITFDQLPEFRTVIESNILFLYPIVKQKGILQMTINEGIKNTIGNKISKVYTHKIAFEEQKPSIRLVDRGMIVPSTNGLKFPFEAINIKAVEVIILKIHEQNINQFFQVNNYGDNYEPSELRRVGKRIEHKVVPIINSNTADYGQWKRYEIDLSNIIKKEPNAIYQVVLKFKKEYTTLACDGNPDFSPIKAQKLSSQEDVDNFNNQFATYDYYDDYYPNDYDYEQRDNPCSSSYYVSSNTTQKKLIYHSDIGLIAKKNSIGDGVIFATNLLNSKPIENVDIQLFDFQNVLIQSGKTDKYGSFSFGNKKSKVFVAKAIFENNISYLKLDDVAAQNTTFFDVSGAELAKGLKGFIYGERGVWRPGDSLFLTFIIEDKLNKLPPNYPVSFDLIDPQGQLVYHTVSTNDINRMYAFATKTESNAPTGHWQGVFKVGGATFYKDLRIESILPNRLKINIDLSKKIIYSNNQDVSGTINVFWLNGAIGSNLKTTVDVSYKPQKNTFKGFEKYDFNDITSSFYAENQLVADNITNQNGQTSFVYSINKDLQFSSLMDINFNVKTYEEGGSFSSYSTHISYSPYSSYVGLQVPKSSNESAIVYETNKEQIFEVANVSEEGFPIKSNVIEVSLYKLDWHWWYDNSDNNLYMDFNAAVPLLNQIVKIDNGKGNFRLKIDNENWGRYLVRIKDASGHICTKILYFDWPGYGANSNTGGASIISVSSEKKSYNVGDKIKVFIPTLGIGQALISIENGSKILKSEWIETNSNLTTYTFDALPEYAPNIFVHVTLLQPHSQTANDLPLRLYGICGVEIADKNNIITPIIETSSEFKPLENCTISIKEQSNKPMTYTLAIVDEGLLDITRFITPNPYNTFYAKESLGISTWDLYDHVMGCTTGKIGKNLTIGGDENLKKGNDTPLNRFRPVVKYFGPVTLAANGKNTHTFKMPNYVGSVKIMAVATCKNAYGNSEKVVPVRKPLMLLATLPRVCAPDEEIAVPVNIFSMSKYLNNITLSIQASGVIETTQNTSTTIKLSENSNGLVWFKVKVKPQIGQGRLKIVAVSGKEVAQYDVTIDSRNPVLPQTSITDKSLEANQQMIYNITPNGVSGSNNLTLEVSNIPAINLDLRLKYLMQYPYGCLEQTTSAVFPQLYLHKFIDLDINQKSKIQQNINAGIDKIAKFQTSDGGFGYWQGDNEANTWASIYAFHFLYEAEKNGYVLNPVFKSKCLKYLTKSANQWQPKNSNYYYNSDLVQAYRLYVLALAGQQDQAGMNRLKEYPTLSYHARCRLAAGYAILGQNDIALSLISSKNITSKYTKNEIFENDYFASSVRDNALLLESMVMLKNKQNCIELAKIVSSNLASTQYMNTQEIAFSLLSLASMQDLFGAKDDLKFSYSQANASFVKAQTKMPVAQIKLNAEKQSKITFINTSKTLQYVRFIQTGVPEFGKEKSYANQIDLQMRYTTLNDNPLDISTLEHGTSFFATITVRHPGILPNYKNIALKQIFASGWEIVNTSFDNENPSSKNSQLFDYQDIRDDRMYTFFSLNRNETKTFKVKLNASYIGKFYLPSQIVESMYQGEIGAAIAGKWVSVVKSDKIN